MYLHLYILLAYSCEVAELMAGQFYYPFPKTYTIPSQQKQGVCLPSAAQLDIVV